MKKIFIFIFIASAAPLGAFATSSSSIELPSGFVASIWTNFNQLFAGLSDYTNLLLGVLLVMLVIGYLVSMLHHPNK